jgi:hypothetical protein
MKYYKLLTQDLTSHSNTKWEIGTPITVQKEGNKMCSDQVLHCYNHPLLAVILNPIHANIKNPKLFEISVDKIVNSDSLKFASKSQTLVKEITLPEISLEHKIQFAIKVAKLTCKNEKWNLWADSWLSGEDRSKESADAAAYAATYAAADAAYAAANGAANGAAAYAANAAAAYTANAAEDKNEFNQKIIKLIESIYKYE